MGFDSLSRERTIAGLQVTRARGRFGGKPTIQSLDPKQAALARKRSADGSMPAQEICAQSHSGRSTLYRSVHEERRAAAAERELASHEGAKLGNIEVDGERCHLPLGHRPDFGVILLQRPARR